MMNFGDLLLYMKDNLIFQVKIRSRMLKPQTQAQILFKGGPSISINSQMAIAGPSVNQGNAQQSFVNSNTNVYTAARNTVPLHVQSKKENRQTLSKLPTPIKVENLEHFLVGYETQLKDKLIHGFSFGFSINSCFSTSLNKKIFPPNHKSARENYHVVQSKLNKEIEAGRVKGPFTKPPFPLFVCSPLGLVPKKEPNSYRLIHDLSYPKGDSVNSGISPEFSAVQYQNIETVIDLVQSYESNCLMSKTDIEHAFRLIPIAKKDHHLLGFHWDKQFYYDVSLPMGASSSCQLFEAFSTALHWILNAKFQIYGVSHLLDDFFFVGKAGSNECYSALQTFLCLADKLGVPIKSEKTQLPTTCITIYGIEIDSTQMVARLPMEKIEKILQLLSKYKCKRSISLRELQSLLGLLNFACGVIIPGRAFLRRLFDLTIGHTSPHYRINLNSDARLDLKLWYSFIENYNGKSCFLFKEWVSSDFLKLFSDAAGTYGGFAAVFGSKWFSGKWPPELIDLHITVKELFPIVLAIDIWGPLLANHKILFLTDNSAVAEIINKTSSREKNIMRLIRRLVLAALKYNIYFRAKHIPGKTNVICDLLSRFSFQEAHQIAPWLSPTPVAIPPQFLHL